MIELPIREMMTKVLSNPMLSSLMTTKKCQINPNTELTLEGDMDFSLSFQNQSIVITYHNIKAKITYYPTTWAKAVKVDGRLTKVVISKDKITLAIDGLPDQVINLI